MSGQSATSLADIGRMYLTSPFEFAKMGVWLIPLLGFGQATTKLWSSIFGEGSRITAFIEAFSSQHSVSNLFRSAGVLNRKLVSEEFQALAGKIIAGNAPRTMALSGAIAQ